MMIDRWIAEATECDFKVALEVNGCRYSFIRRLFLPITLS